MKVKPVIRNELYVRHTSFVVNFKIKQNITFITGDSGCGKSTIFSFLQELAAIDKTICCYNRLNQNSDYKATITHSDGKLFIIDDADYLIDDNLRHFIATDSKNQYILIGQNAAGLILNLDEIMELQHEMQDNQIYFLLNPIF